VVHELVPALHQKIHLSIAIDVARGQRCRTGDRERGSRGERARSVAEPDRDFAGARGCDVRLPIAVEVGDHLSIAVLGDRRPGACPESAGSVVQQEGRGVPDIGLEVASSLGIDEVEASVPIHVFEEDLA